MSARSTQSSDAAEPETPPAAISLPSTDEVVASISPMEVTTAAQASMDPKKGARLREANRAQISWGRIDLDAQLPADHSARAIWAVIERLDLSVVYAQIVARDGGAGAPAIDPKILLALWVYATSEGEGSAREIHRLTQLHAAYRWICGGVDVNDHTISDFRSQEGETVNALITQILALLMKGELIDLSRTAQDGTRVRASAGAASFRREDADGSRNSGRIRSGNSGRSRDEEREA